MHCSNNPFGPCSVVACGRGGVQVEAVSPVADAVSEPHPTVVRRSSRFRDPRLAILRGSG
jgi:hypothetical protein